VPPGGHSKLYLIPFSPFTKLALDVHEIGVGSSDEDPVSGEFSGEGS